MGLTRCDGDVKISVCLLFANSIFLFCPLASSLWSTSILKSFVFLILGVAPNFVSMFGVSVVMSNGKSNVLCPVGERGVLQLFEKTDK